MAIALKLFIINSLFNANSLNWIGENFNVQEIDYDFE
jgi:hypothetical protein